MQMSYTHYNDKTSVFWLLYMILFLLTNELWFYEEMTDIIGTYFTQKH